MEPFSVFIANRRFPQLVNDDPDPAGDRRSYGCYSKHAILLSIAHTMDLPPGLPLGNRANVAQ